MFGMKNMVYVITFGVGKVCVGSTRHGEWCVRQACKRLGGSGYEILERLALPDELALHRYRWLSKYVKDEFLFKGNSKADIRLANRLFLDGEKRDTKGNPQNLRGKKALTDAQKFVRDNL